MIDSNRGKTVLVSSRKNEQFHMNSGKYISDNSKLVSCVALGCCRLMSGVTCIFTG